MDVAAVVGHVAHPRQGRRGRLRDAAAARGDQPILGTGRRRRLDRPERSQRVLLPVRALCLELGRAAIGDQKIGQVLSSAPVGADGVWPCEPVRNVLEDIASREIGIGIGVAVYNARGMHRVTDDAADERALAEKYRAWSRKLAFGHAYVASVLEETAQRYDREAEREISDAAVRRRLKGW